MCVCMHVYACSISVAGGDVAGIFFLMLGLFLLLCVINLGLATLVPLKQGLGLDKADAGGEGHATGAYPLGK